MKLPYTYQPKPPTVVEVGSQEVGVLNFLKFGHIRECEQRQLEAIDFEQAKSQKFLFGLAKKIAETEGFSIEVALVFLQSPNDALGLLIKYQEDISELQILQDQAIRLRLEKLTVFLKERVCDKEGKLLLESWAIENTESELQDPRLIEAIELFVADERGIVEDDSQKKSPSKSRSTS